MTVTEVTRAGETRHTLSETRHTLKINKFEVWVALGCSAEERSQTQPVYFTLEIKFLKNLSGTETDQLNDAVDYVHLTDVVKTTAKKKPYQLIEHMNSEVFHSLVLILRQHKIFADVELTVKKVRVPIEGLTEGVEFKCQQILS